MLLATAVLRPEWMILVVVALPPSVLTPIPTLLLIVIMVATLFGFLLQGGLRLGARTGVYPLVGIIALAIAMKAAVPTAATAPAGGMLKAIIYYTLLMLVAFQAAVNGRLRVDAFINALLLGIVGAAVLQPFVGAISSFDTISSNPFHGKIAYLAAMGFGVTYVRLSLARSAHRRQSGLDAFLMVAFLCLTAIGFGRAAWIAALWVFALVSKWTGRKSFWFVAAVSVVIALTVPVVAQRILPGGTADVANPAALAQVTTGRSVLWGELWKRATDALPFGHGWGYVESLNSFDIFGSARGFSSGRSSFVFPHNDFLYLFLQLGIVGAALLVAFWLSLLHKIRFLARSRIESVRYGVRVLVPVIIVMFVVQLFDNGFAIQFVAEKFFLAAGLIFGLHYAVRQRLVGPSQGSAGFDG